MARKRTVKPDAEPIEQVGVEVLTSEGKPIPVTAQEAKEVANLPVKTENPKYIEIISGVMGAIEKSSGRVFDLTKTADDKEARSIRQQIRAARIDVDKIRKAGGEFHRNAIKSINEEAEQVTNWLAPFEKWIDDQIKADEERREIERKRKEEENLKRITAIKDRLAIIKKFRWDNRGAKTSVEVNALGERLKAIAIDDSFQEFRAEAMEVQEEILNEIADRLAELMKIEGHAAEMEKLRLENERLRRIEAERNQIRGWITDIVNLGARGRRAKSVAGVDEVITILSTFEVGASFKEFTDEAKRTRSEALEECQERLATLKAQEVAKAAETPPESQGATESTPVVPDKPPVPVVAAIPPPLPPPVETRPLAKRPVTLANTQATKPNEVAAPAAPEADVVYPLAPQLDADDEITIPSRLYNAFCAACARVVSASFGAASPKMREAVELCRDVYETATGEEL